MDVLWTAVCKMTSQSDAFAFGGLIAGSLCWLHVRQTMRMKTRVPEINKLEAKLSNLEHGGTDNVQIIIDFDRTLTTYWYAPSTKGASCHGVVEHMWNGELKAKAEAFNAFYMPIEVAHDTTTAYKIPYMEQWYSSINELIVESRLTRVQLVELVRTAPVLLRPGAVQLLNWADTHGVPVTVFSAGIADVLEQVLLQKWRSPLPPLIRVVSNRMIFDPMDGRVTGFALPLLHMFNKTSTTAEKTDPTWSSVMKGRKNVLLVGDGLGDAMMADGLHLGMEWRSRTTAPTSDAEMRCVRVGLLNHNVDVLMPAYEAAYDIVITDDGPLDEVLRIAHRIECGGVGSGSTGAAAMPIHA